MLGAFQPLHRPKRRLYAEHPRRQPESPLNDHVRRPSAIASCLQSACGSFWPVRPIRIANTVDHQRWHLLAAGNSGYRPLPEEEFTRLRAAWSEPEWEDDEAELLNELLGPKRLEEIDPFDQAQLAYVIRVCRKSRTQSDAGRKLFRVTRLGRKHTNDADRLSKYLARFGLDWATIPNQMRQ